MEKVLESVGSGHSGGEVQFQELIMDKGDRLEGELELEGVRHLVPEREGPDVEVRDVGAQYFLFLAFSQGQGLFGDVVNRSRLGQVGQVGELLLSAYFVGADGLGVDLSEGELVCAGRSTQVQVVKSYFFIDRVPEVAWLLRPLLVLVLLNGD
jgi:hypothetical protein